MEGRCNFEFWYDVAEYANANWKYKGTPKEIAMAAFEYRECWQISLHQHNLEYTLCKLCTQLKEDADNGDADAKRFFDTIMAKANKYIWEVK